MPLKITGFAILLYVVSENADCTRFAGESSGADECSSYKLDDIGANLNHDPDPGIFQPNFHHCT